MSDQTYKSLRVKKETHAKIKTQAARLEMTIDEYLANIAALNVEVRLVKVLELDPNGDPIPT